MVPRSSNYGGLEEVVVTGTLTTSADQFLLHSNNGKVYRISAIKLYAAVSPEYGSEKYRPFVGLRVRVHGLSDGTTIWNASVEAI